MLWFYAGQIRGRTAAELGPNSSTPMLIQALQQIVGQPLNAYAGGDQARWLQAIDGAIAWDLQNPMPMSTAVSVGRSGPLGSVEFNFDPAASLHFEKLSPRVTRATFDAAYANQRQGIQGLRASVARVDPAELAAQRKANGLE